MKAGAKTASSCGDLWPRLSVLAVTSGGSFFVLLLLALLSIAVLVYVFYIGPLSDTVRRL